MQHALGSPPGQDGAWPKPIHLVAGLLFCGCGEKMYVFSRSPKYVCPQCRNKIAIEDIEAIYREELEDFFVSQEKVQTHLSRANEFLTEKKERVVSHTRQLEKVRTEMRKVYDLYQADKITPVGFGKLNRPLLPNFRSSKAKSMPSKFATYPLTKSSPKRPIFIAFGQSSPPQSGAGSSKASLRGSLLLANEIDITLCDAVSSEELTKKQRNLCQETPVPAPGFFNPVRFSISKDTF